MNLKQTLVKYKLRGNVISDEVLYSGTKNGKSYEVHKAIVVEVMMKTYILYKVIDGKKYALLNSDIFFMDNKDIFRKVPKIKQAGDLFIEGANLSKINNHT